MNIGIIAVGYENVL